MEPKTPKHAGLTERDVARGVLVLAGADFATNVFYSWLGSTTGLPPWHPVVVVTAFFSGYLLFRYDKQITLACAKIFKFILGEQKAVYSYTSTMGMFQRKMSKMIAYAEQKQLNLITTVGAQKENMISTLKDAKHHVRTVGEFLLGVILNLVYLLAYIVIAPWIFLSKVVSYAERDAQQERSEKRAYIKVDIK